MIRPTGNNSVFLNCPFDSDYKPVFEAIVFAVLDCGFVPRCALESEDAGEVRFEKILRIIRSCRYGIHDISRTEPDAANDLPRFNMPFELGLFLGCKRFGAGSDLRKVCLVLDREPYRYQKFISDIAGQEVRSHSADPRVAVQVVRQWLRVSSRRTRLPGGTEIWRRYRQFRQDLPEICQERKILAEELTYLDLSEVIRYWLQQTR